MAKVKVTVTIPEEELALAKEAVRAGAAPSLSAYVTEALVGHRPGPSLQELVAELRAEIGPPTEEERAWARMALGLDG
jgi:hypothetical protein